MAQVQKGGRTEVKLTIIKVITERNLYAIK
jgi:hypothetical protein